MANDTPARDEPMKLLISVSSAIFTFVGLAVLGAAAQAQELSVDDWEYGEDAASRTAAAMVEFSGGQAIVIQCRAGALSVVLLGVPQTTATFRTLELYRADGRSDAGRWQASSPSTAFRSTAAARDARFFKGGGVLTVRSREGDPDRMRMELDLPTESKNVDRVLTACDRPLIERRDTMPRVDETLLDEHWLRGLQLGSRPGNARADISCIVGREMRPVNCLIEAEAPKDGGFGRSLTRAVERQKIAISDPALIQDHVFYLSLEVVTQTSSISR
ncbi:hypothetical protein [Brevundimonas diminuta]|uniref:hypothetical protein n=1 Tax=Brevundimonas diminuta TaxID=293 RepID=UPI001F5632CB|nr:hypothetical protein [Brevundimonas diminuta]